MKSQKQLVRHSPDEGLYGDCDRTCFAMILNLDAADVPHWYSDGGGSGGDAIKRGWLAGRGLTTASWPIPGDVPLEQIIAQACASAPDAAFILTCKSSRGCAHAVVVSGGEIHNPSDSTIVGPTDEGWWWVEFIVPGPGWRDPASTPEA